MVGWEGIWGTLATVVLIAIACYTDCPFSTEEQCEGGKLEDLDLALHQFQADPSLICFAIAIMISSALFNGFGSNLTKYSSATTRNLIE